MSGCSGRAINGRSAPDDTANGVPPVPRTYGAMADTGSTWMGAFNGRATGTGTGEIRTGAAEPSLTMIPPCVATWTASARVDMNQPPCLKNFTAKNPPTTTSPMTSQLILSLAGWGV